MTKVELVNFIDIEVKKIAYLIIKKDIETSEDISYKIYFKNQGMNIPMINIKLNPAKIYMSYDIITIYDKDKHFKQSKIVIDVNEIGYQIAYDTIMTYIDFIVNG